MFNDFCKHMAHLAGTKLDSKTRLIRIVSVSIVLRSPKVGRVSLLSKIVYEGVWSVTAEGGETEDVLECADYTLSSCPRKHCRNQIQKSTEILYWNPLWIL